MNLTSEVSQDLRQDFAKIRRSLLSTLTRKVDFGELGEQTVEIQYDADLGTRACWDTPATPGYFHITGMVLNGIDLWSAFDEETQRIYTAELKHELERKQPREI